ncbi:T9SS type A sorting domain-containing protein, partial [Fluviicola sp.]|uniref:T9SS type A sorting domain-containing protein n=1 Tax=Fluviicola sp. TaxID=1917219 RepID=UPI00262AF15C
PSGFGEVRFADINNDNYEDVLLTASNFTDTMTMNFPPSYTNYYLNDGSGNFSIVSGTPIDGIFGTVAIADFNGDGLKETVISGGTIVNDATIMVFTKMYGVEFCLSAPIMVNTFVTPSAINECTGTVTVTVQGTPDFTFDLQNGSPAITSTSNQLTIDSLCPGIYSLFTIDGNGDTLTSTFVIPTDSNYIFNNYFGPSSPVLGELSVTVENCDIDYASVSTAEIDTFTVISQDSVLIYWAITDVNGTTIIPAIYDLSAGYGNYYLQLELYCQQKSTGQYFVITEGFSFDDGTTSLGIQENKTFAVSIAPNPANDLITIQFDTENADLTILDLQGKVILSKQIQNHEKVSLSNFNSGIYLFNISSKNGESISRVIKY